MKNINFRFSNPVYNPGTLKLHLDVEATADVAAKLFGLNLRFLYDTRIFQPGNASTFKVILPPGYRQYNAYWGNSPTGWAMFGSAGPITYAHVAVELTSPASAIEISDDPVTWTKLFTIEVTSRTPLQGNQCPSFIWDKRVNPLNGGYMGQGDGLTCTEFTHVDGSGVLRSSPTIEWANHFNWSPNHAATRYPWGVPNTNNCFTV